MAPISQRQQELLNFIISHYVKTAEPVGSNTIAGKGGFDLSPATIRNEMAALEDAGYITQPHTSAGRVPTEKGYHFYIATTSDLGPLPKRDQEHLAEAVESLKPSQ